MTPLRTALLWASRNGWLRTNVPRWPFVRRATRRFMPGEDLEAALTAAASFQAEGIGVWLTHLGENLTSLGEAQAVTEHYVEALGRVARAGLRAEISVKPTQLGLDLDEAATLANARRLAAAQAEAGGMLWLDMEDHTYVDGTLALVRTLRDEGATVGVCLQAYLRRTAADLEALAGSGIGVRLVKGAYAEPAAVAFPAKRDVDLNFLAARGADARAEPRSGRPAGRLRHPRRRASGTDRRPGRGQRHQSCRDTRSACCTASARPSSAAWPERATRCATLIAYGTAWYPWYLRRLAERPANVLFVLRQLVPGR